MQSKIGSYIVLVSVRVGVAGLFLFILCGLVGAQRPTPTPTNGGRIVIPEKTVPKVGIRSDTSARHWTLLSAGMDANSLVFDWQGGMYIIGINGEMYARDEKSGKWNALNPGVKVKSMTVKPDGTIIAPDTANKFIYSRVNGKWTKIDGYADQIVAAKDGKVYALVNGTIAESGGSINGSGLLPSTTKFKYMSAATKTNGLYLVDANDKLRGYDVGTGISGEIVGGGKAKVVCGTGYGVRAGQFINGAGTDNNTYFFEVSPTNKWVPLQSQTYMKFIALNPVTNVLYGVGVDNKIYSYLGSF